MPENPYSPPAKDFSDGPRRSILCASLFWLTTIIGFSVLSASVSGTYHNVRFALENGAGLPPYIIGVYTLLAISALLLFISAWHWRIRRVRPASIYLAVAGITFFGGPRVLLSLLT